MYEFYNANPLGRHVNDCTVRAISYATNRSWDKVYRELSEFAQVLGTMPDDVVYIDSYLAENFIKVYGCKYCNKITVGEFVKKHPTGTYLITMSGHITCAKNGIIYDTFDPSERFVWGAYKV
jgi:hypothetical protein